MATGTEAYYQARAREYDQVYDKPERQDDLETLRAWLPGVLAGRRVLEVAAGTGYWTSVYAGRAAAVLATDASPATLEVARGRRTWPDSVRFGPADAFALGLPDGPAGSFDAAFAGFFWSHVDLASLDSFLAGLTARLDRPATVVFTDNRYVEGSNYPMTRTDAGGNTFQERRLTDGSVWEVRKNFPSAAELRARLAPFARDVEIRELTYYWTAVATIA
jgi:SAM-dependent methyltransferase